GAAWRLTSADPRRKQASARPATGRAARPVRLLHGPPLLAGAAVLPLGARAAILVDGGDGRVLWAKQPHLRLPVASTTKIMTALLVLQRLPLESTIRIGWTVPRVPLVREGLRSGERVPARKLLYRLLRYSGNAD